MRGLTADGISPRRGCSCQTMCLQCPWRGGRRVPWRRGWVVPCRACRWDCKLGNVSRPNSHARNQTFSYSLFVVWLDTPAALVMIISSLGGRLCRFQSCHLTPCGVCVNKKKGRYRNEAAAAQIQGRREGIVRGIRLSRPNWCRGRHDGLRNRAGLSSMYCKTRSTVVSVGDVPFRKRRMNEDDPVADLLNSVGPM